MEEQQIIALYRESNQEMVSKDIDKLDWMRASTVHGILGDSK